MLKYIGRGEFIPGVPMRDLAEVDLDALNVSKKRLLDSGLYIEREEEKQERGPVEDKALIPAYKNKNKKRSE